MLMKYTDTNTHFSYQYFVFMSCTARRDIETLVSSLINLLVNSIPDRMGKLKTQRGMGKLPSIYNRYLCHALKPFLIGRSAFTFFHFLAPN